MNDPYDNRHLWAVVLAAGDGRRLNSLTTTSSGVAIPKQYCSVWGGAPLLQEALARTAAVAPPEQRCAVVAAQHWRWWEPLHWAQPPLDVIVQPQNRGTAVGVLLALLQILDRDPEAQVLMIPSDHHVTDEAVLATALRRASARAAAQPERVILLGLAPEEPDPELGYIVPGPEDDDVRTVVEFVEKPAPAAARALIDRGALWNGFLVCAQGRALLHLFEARFPELVAGMRRAVRSGGGVLARFYRDLAPLDFSREILRGQEWRLRVLPVPACGWSDLGCVRSVVKVVRRGRRTEARIGPWVEPTLSLSAQQVAAAPEPAQGTAAA